MNSVLLGTTSDEWVSFWLIKRQKNSKWVNYVAKDSLIKGTYGYPVLQHLIISKFPKKLWGIVGRFLNSVYDIFVALIVFFTTSVIATELELSTQIAGLNLPIIATILFLTTPVLIPIEPRTRTIKARTVGLFLTNLYFILLGSIIFYQKWLLLVLVVLLGILIIVSSLFAVQVLVFFSLFLSLYLKSGIPVLIVLLIMVLSYFVKVLNAKEPLRFNWHHKIWYWRNYETGPATLYPNHIHDIIRLPLYLFKNPKLFFNIVYTKITPINAFLFSPSIYFLVILWFTERNILSHLFQNSLLMYMWGIVLAGVVAFILTSFKGLNVFGEAERYFEYNAFAISILMTFVLSSLNPEVASSTFFLILFFHLTVICINFIFRKYKDFFRAEPDIPSEMQEVVLWINKNVKSKSLLSIPCKLTFLLSYLIQDKNIQYYYRLILKKGERGFKYFEEDMGGYVSSYKGEERSYQVFGVKPSQLLREYGPFIMVIEKKYVSGLEKTWGKEFGVLKNPLFENNRYSIYAIDQSVLEHNC